MVTMVKRIIFVFVLCTYFSVPFFCLFLSFFLCRWVFRELPKVALLFKVLLSVLLTINPCANMQNMVGMRFVFDGRILESVLI